MLRVLVVLFLVVATAVPAGAQTIRVWTSLTLSPFVSGTEQAPAGFHYELLQLLADRSGIDIELTFGPWERAQKAVQRGENAYLMAPTRNAQREDLFDWIIPVLELDRVFLTTGPQIDDYESARALTGIAARGAYFRSLEAQGFDNVSQVDTENALRMLEAGRVDAVFTLRERAFIVWGELGFAPEELVSGASIKAVTLWLAGPKGSDPDITKSLRAALDEIKSDGSYDALSERHFGPPRRTQMKQK
ncbi:MAG: transporter substrate-binding domain-containing protein [Pseudomonadota bacterium]